LFAFVPPKASKRQNKLLNIIFKRQLVYKISHESISTYSLKRLKGRRSILRGKLDL
jgi:hypothetical protein